MGDRGAKALAELIEGLDPEWNSSKSIAEHALGEHGMFIADVTKHEPIWGEDGIGCRCGWRGDDLGRVPYFDHIAE